MQPEHVYCDQAGCQENSDVNHAWMTSCYAVFNTIRGLQVYMCNDGIRGLKHTTLDDDKISIILNDRICIVPDVFRWLLVTV